MATHNLSLVSTLDSLSKICCNNVQHHNWAITLSSAVFVEFHKVKRCVARAKVPYTSLPRLRMRLFLCLFLFYLFLLVLF